MLLTLKRQGEDLVLVTKLQNDSPIPLVIDREMVFLFGIDLRAADGSIIRTERVHPAPHRNPPADWRERFVRIEPGRSFQRELDLRRGWWSFVVAIGSSLRGELGIVHDRVSAYESFERLPPTVAADQVSEITVRYGPHLWFREGFVQYTGLQPDSVNLFMGPLEATLRIGAATTVKVGEGVP